MKRIVQALLGAAGLGVLMLVFAGSAQAADLGTVTVSYGGSGNVFTPTSLTGQTGDTFTLVNTRNQDNGISYVSVVNGSGAVTLSGSSCTAISSCPVYDKTTSPPNAGVYTVVEPGTFSVMRHLVSGGSPTDSTIGTLTISGSGTVVANEVEQTPPSYQFTFGMPGSSAECLSSRQTVVSGTWVSLPTTSCMIPGARLVGWQIPGSSDVFNLGAQVLVSGDQRFTTVFATDSISVTQNANVGADISCLVNGQIAPTRVETTSVLRTAVTLARSAPCAPAGLSLKGWNTKGDGTGTTYAPGATVPKTDVESLAALTVYAVWGAPSLTMDPATASVSVGQTSAVKISDPGMARQQVSVSATDAISLPSGASATVTLGADGAASVPYLALSTAGTGTLKASAGGVTATATITVTKPADQSIIIVGERATVSGKPGIRIDGQTTGFAPGSTVVPYFRFPGETTYSQGSARPVVQTDGSFTWQRKTGKKFYVYVTSGDEQVKSNRVIIPAQ